MYVTNGEIVEKIFREGKYKDLCFKIAKKPLLAEELYSEFLKKLLEVKERSLHEAVEEGYLDFLCIRTIRNLWNNKNRVKSYTIGSTNPLFEYTSTHEEAPKFSSVETYSYKIDYISKEAEKLVWEEFNHEDGDRAYGGRVFYYCYPKLMPGITNELKKQGMRVNVEINSPADYARYSGIEYWSVKKMCDKMRRYLQEKLKSKWLTT